MYGAFRQAAYMPPSTHPAQKTRLALTKKPTITGKSFLKKRARPQTPHYSRRCQRQLLDDGETGPCGPCSELHVDLTPNGDSEGRFVNKDSDLCIEIWNLVFIQYNAEADGSFIDLPAKHVDTGMGFERVCSLIQNTRGFTDFSQKPTNYSSDVFRKIFSRLEALSELAYHDIYPHHGFHCI